MEVHSNFSLQKWEEIKVGTIIRVKENEFFPADLVVLNTSLPKGWCYIETKNLDGETNLKHKQGNKQLIKMSQTKEEIIQNFSQAVIECEKENASIYTFQGKINFPNKDDLEIGLDVDQMCLRGSSLRNTEWIIGIVVYTGSDTKIMMNSAKSKPKFSKIETASNRYIFISIIF